MFALTWITSALFLRLSFMCFVWPVLVCHCHRYPPKERGSVDVTVGDAARVTRHEYLNDSLIDFYLKFLLNETFPEVRPRAALNVMVVLQTLIN